MTQIAVIKNPMLALLCVLCDLRASVVKRSAALIALLRAFVVQRTNLSTPHPNAIMYPTTNSPMSAKMWLTYPA